MMSLLSPAKAAIQEPRSDTVAMKVPVCAGSGSDKR